MQKNRIYTLFRVVRINSFIVGCKFEKTGEDITFSIELIVTQWDVNSSNGWNNFCWTLELIVTQWDVNFKESDTREAAIGRINSYIVGCKCSSKSSQPVSFSELIVTQWDVNRLKNPSKCPFQELIVTQWDVNVLIVFVIIQTV